MGNLVGKLVLKTASCGLLGGNINSQNGSMLGFWGKVVPKTVLCWAFGGKVVPKRRRFFKPACQKLPQHDALSSVSSKLKQNKQKCNCLKLKLKLFDSLSSPSLHVQTFPRTKYTLIKHSNFPSVTHSLASVDTTAQGSKKQSSKEKGELTFPFSSVIFNFFVS